MKDEWMVIAGLQEHGCLPRSTRIHDICEALTRKKAMALAERIKDGFWWVDNGEGAFWYRPVYVFVQPWKEL